MDRNAIVWNRRVLREEENKEDPKMLAVGEWHVIDGRRGNGQADGICYTGSSYAKERVTHQPCSVNPITYLQISPPPPKSRTKSNIPGFALTDLWLIRFLENYDLFQVSNKIHFPFCAHPAPNLGKNIWHGELVFSVSGIISKFKSRE